MYSDIGEKRELRIEDVPVVVYPLGPTKIEAGLIDDVHEVKIVNPDVLIDKEFQKYNASFDGQERIAAMA